ncbi:conserved virulence factor C family protein [Neobacillus sp. PS3-34]|uniref:conserved virulence factor C family protein n=1 Tax=Neobacillus sp. PS3-34 TaxID=3070678 RepID=UPI0027DFC91E|nr:conserved virulence factor C family protein [Neobacillus sp. PS3-34]WML47774.1 conserved virulence factor C family protein [Neobacillus sp. PS3-34]
MKIVSIEPTPSPNTMKITLDSELPMGTSHNYKKDTSAGAPEAVKAILEVEGIKGVYHVADFLAVERNAKYDWKDLLPKVRQAFGGEVLETEQGDRTVDEHFGEIKVQVQMFKGIPLQVKLTDGSTEKRFGMPDYFLKAREYAQLEEDNYILLRTWKDFGVRYGEFEQIGHDVTEELIASYPAERLDSLVESARSLEPALENKQKRQRIKVTKEDLANPDWKHRYQLLEQMDDPSIEDLHLLAMALQDEKASIRRLATVYLGMIKDKSVLPLLYNALTDKTVTVRRTAGDCLSDLGFEEAEDNMAAALKDDSKLVRWRAAMFLYEAGSEKSLSALKAAEDDPEFEVSLQVKMAIERIEGGEEAKGSVWKQMTESRKS